MTLLGRFAALANARTGGSLANGPLFEKVYSQPCVEPLAARRLGIAVAVVAREQAVHSPKEAFPLSARLYTNALGGVASEVVEVNLALQQAFLFLDEDVT